VNIIKQYTILIVLLLILVACTPPGAGTPTPTKTEPPTSPLAPASPLSPLQLPPETPEVVITYERNGGIAGVENVWRIYTDGHVEFSSRNNPTTETQLPAGAVDNAMKRITDSGFFELDDEYMPKNRCCDLFTHTITVIQGQTAKSVVTMDGAEYPQALLDTMAVIADLIQQ